MVSPHLDDAILSAGGAIDGGTIVTVLAGYPPEWFWPSPFDNASGFTSSVEAVRARRVEDIAACAELGAKPLHLDFLDGQYGMPNDVGFIVEALTRLFDLHRTVAVPLGLAHPDHRLVAKACRLALRQAHRWRCVVYADLPSAQLWPGHVAGAVKGWRNDGFELTPTGWNTSWAAKVRAVEKYESQRRFPELALPNLTGEHGWTARRVD